MKNSYLIIILCCFSLLFVNSKSIAQYTYINDIGNSSLQVSQVNDLSLSISLLPKSINYINLGYSPIKHLGIFVGSHFHRINNTRFNIHVKGRGINAAIGTYYFFRYSKNRFHHSRNQKEIGTLFYTKIGYGRSGVENVTRTSKNKKLISEYEYQRAYWDLGLQLITKKAKLDFNFKYSRIQYIAIAFVGDFVNQNTYTQVVENNLEKNNMFNDFELNVQTDIGKGYLNLTGGLVVFFPLRKGEPQIIYRRSRSFYTGINININQLTAYVKNNKRLFKLPKFLKS